MTTGDTNKWLNTIHCYGNGFDEFDRFANTITSALENPLATIDKVMDKIDFQLNQYTEKDGTMVIELAVVGMTEKDLKVTVKTEQNVSNLSIKSIIPELTDEEKQKINERTYRFKKIKSMSKMDITLLLDKTLDVSKTTKTVENGLLTIRIPVKAEEKPVEFEI